MYHTQMFTSKILFIVFVNTVSFDELDLSAHTNPPLLFLFSFFLHFVCHASLLWVSLDTLPVSLFHPLSLFLFRSVNHFVPFKHILHSITPPSFLLVLSSTFPYSSFLHPSFLLSALLPLLRPLRILPLLCPSQTSFSTSKSFCSLAPPLSLSLSFRRGYLVFGSITLEQRYLTYWIDKT